MATARPGPDRVGRGVEPAVVINGVPGNGGTRNINVNMGRDVPIGASITVSFVPDGEVAEAVWDNLDWSTSRTALRIVQVTLTNNNTSTVNLGSGDLIVKAVDP